MKSTLFFLVALPFLAALSAVRLRLGPARTLAASVTAEILGLFLYAQYNRWRVASILSGKASGAVFYVGTDAPRERVLAFLTFCGFGCLIGLIVLALQRVLHRRRP